ncbi:hypothetical protein B0T18DRAFT_172171 [Schizothecium vesticola]|uniref:Uncharacterized protein n=1 Tax=Schizothecium vesticola TaxID=314040 RepID=A0AA40EP37_9PEZI|nr:hypothetical protein B0T18DRAFT_172171 [Schizothecium vesticola]
MPRQRPLDTTSPPPWGPHVRPPLVHRAEYRLPSQRTKGDGTGRSGPDPRSGSDGRHCAGTPTASKHLSWLHWRRGIPNTMLCLSNINHRHLDASWCGLADWTGYVGTSRCEVVLHDAVSGRESISQYLLSPDLINLIWDLGSRGTIVAWYRIWCRSLPSQVCLRHDNALSSAGNDGAGWFSRGGTVRQPPNERWGVALQSLSAVRRQGPVARSWAPPSGPPICEKSRLIICGFMEFTIQRPQKLPRLFQGQWAID